MIIDRRAFVIGVGSTLALPGCATLPESARILPGPPFSSLLQHIKHDVATYILEVQDAPFRQTLCGPAAAFLIEKIKITVTVVQQSGSSAAGGLTLPINLVTVGGSASRGRTLDNSVSVTLSLLRVDDESELTEVPPQSPHFDGTPIRDALIRLRDDLLGSGNTRPCFSFGMDNVVKWGFQIVDRGGSGLRFSLLLFSIGSEATTTHTFANTVEATFSGTGFGDPGI